MLTNNQYQILQITYNEMVEIWILMCNKHEELYHLTCQEYVLLLKSEIDELEKTIDQKIQIINEINFYDEKRKRQLQGLKNALSISSVLKVSDFIEMIDKYKIDEESKTFFKYNQFLLDFIQKLKEQNKKNQIILNKSLINLKELREKLLGEDSLKTYDMRGLENNGISR